MLFFFLLTAGDFAGLQAANPANDNFAERITVAAAATFLEGDLTGATMESGEPQHPIPQWLQQGPPSRSIWWQWTAPARGGIVLDPRASTFFRKGVYIYRGESLQNLSLVSSSYGDEAAYASVEAGRTYFVCAASDGGEGRIIISLRHYGGASNDNFANRITLTDTHLSVPVNLFATTVEAGEPVGQFGQPFGSGAWWEWTAPVDGSLTVGSDGCGVEMFEGTALNNLQPFGGVFGITEVTAGQRIFFRLSVPPDTKRGLYTFNLIHDFARLISPRGGNFLVGETIPVEVAFAPTDEPVEKIDFYPLVHCALFTEVIAHTLTSPPWRVELTTPYAHDHRASVRIRYRSGREQFLSSDCFAVRNPAPPNDDRTNAVVVGAAGGSVAIPNLTGATLEPAEENLWPWFTGMMGSVWWKWTPSNSGAASIQVPQRTFVRVFKGANFEAVTPISYEPLFRFRATMGEMYWIGLRNFTEYTSSPSDQLTVTLGLPPSIAQNDDFAARLPINGSGQLSADLAFATQEPGEPGSGNSLWWSWSGTESGVLEVEATSATELLLDFTSLVEVRPYRGSIVSGLSEVTAQYGTWPDQSLRFRVNAGEDIALRLSHSSSVSADPNAFFRYTFFPDVGNDAFANRIELSGLPVALQTRFSAASTMEANEPRPFNLFASQWWSWNSPINGEVGVAIHGMSAALRLAIFEGMDLASLTRIHPVTNGAGLLILTAEQGRTYHLQVNGWSDTEFILHLSTGGLNDHFVDSVALTSSNRLIAASNLNATHEAGERTRVAWPPPFSSLPLSGSLWWHFAAPTDGQLTLRHREFQWVYRDQWTGDSVDSLQQLKRDYLIEDDWVVSKHRVTKGQTIHVSLDTLGHTFNGTPLPQSMLLEHDFTTLEIAQPTGQLEFTHQQSIAFSLKPILNEFDGDIREVSLRFGKRRQDGTFDYQGTPHGWPNRLSAPFTHSVSNWPAGIYEVTARGVNSAGELRVSAPELFTIGPANDDFTNRLSVFSSRTTIETLGGTSLESFETNVSPAIRGSAWWQWTAPWSARAFVESAAEIAVYRGTNSESLSLITNGIGKVGFFATEGEAYQIALLRLHGDTNVGPAFFDISIAPEGDNFADRRRQPIYEGWPNGWEFQGRHLTLEEGEPDHGVIDAGGSIWWEIPLTNHGKLTVSFSGYPGGSTEFRLYRGTGFGELEHVPLNAVDQFYWGAELEAGVYQAALITRTNPVNQSARMELSFRSAAPNDHFADAAVLQGTSGVVATPFWFGSVEAGEPHLFWFPPEIPPSSQVPLVQTLWWKWTAPRTGNLDFVIPDHSTWSFEPQFKMELFRGDTLSTLQNVPMRSEYHVHNSQSTMVDFEVSGGETYYIRAGYGNEFGQQGGMFAFRFALSEGLVTNDVMTNAAVLQGTSLQVRGHTAGAREGFVYYDWRPPEEGLAIFESASTNIYISVLCYDANSNLVANALVPPKSALHVRPGNTVRFAVFGSLPVPFEFTVNLVAGKPNDDYDSRQFLVGTSGTFFANALYSSGTFGPNGEATSQRNLYWEWVAPHGGQLKFYNPDGTPATGIGLYEDGGAFSVTRIIAGRTYMLGYFGLEPRQYVYQLEAEEIIPTFSRNGNDVNFLLETPFHSVVRIDVSNDLLQWSPLGLFQSEEGMISLPGNPAQSEQQFFRVTPLW